MEKYPNFINSEGKYKQVVESCKTLGDYTQLMEDKILMQSGEMTEKELWSLIQTMSQDILNSHNEIQQVGVQKWIVGFYNLWQNIRKGKNTDTPQDENTDSEISTSESESVENNSSTETDSGYCTESSSTSDDTHSCTSQETD